MEDKIKSKYGDNTINILDLCSGTGVLGISLAKRVNYNNLVLSDISLEANKLAGLNASLHNISLSINEGDLFENIDSRFDVIISNPPYIDNKENVEDIVYNNEPHLALFAYPCYSFYERIIKDMGKYLNPHYLVGFEIDEGMEEILTKIIHSYLDNVKYEFFKDIYGLLRYLVLEK